MLISEMGGRIEVRTALGQGSTFTVVLNPVTSRVLASPA
jgi:chemotaxis protein histidine kinase CheA